MWQFFIKGGIVMIPLLFCSLAGLVVIIERIIFFSRLNTRDEEEIKLLKFYARQGLWDEARVAAANWSSPVGRVAKTALKQLAFNNAGLEVSVQAAGELEAHRLQRGLGLLDTVVTASPLLGLLGTVTGIIRSFTALSVAGSTQATQLSLGIAEALYTTAFGLIIAIPALFFLNWFYGIAEKKAQSLTSGVQEVLSILRQGSGGSNGV
jgi:biopolymer transport protein ExbB